MTSTEPILVITRVFNAPRTLVWKAHAEAEHLGQWWGPKGFGMQVLSLEFRPGGNFHYCMTTPDGTDMWGLFTYQEIKAPERLVFVNSFADAAGKKIRNPWDASFPLEIRNAITLTEAAGKTTLELRAQPLGASAAENAVFAGMFPSMQGGYGGTLDKLADVLEKLRA